MPSITSAQARTEILRRQAPKGSAKRNKRPAQHILDSTGADLLTLAGGKPAPVKVAAKAVATVKAEQVTDPLKVQANIAWKAAFEAADEGDKRRAAGKAYRAVMEGVTLDKVLATIAA